ncbi:MAG: efflux RND transporter periplasmic adaptor subunit [Candidatus Shapirobacteria bacterium]
MKFIKNNYKKILIGLIVLGIIFGIYKSQSKNTATTVFNPKKDTVYTPKVETIKDELILASSIDSDQIANIHFQNPGKLVWVGVKVGDKVKKGQAIASLDKEQLRKSLATQYNNYRTQLSQFNDTQDQYKKTKENLLVTDTIQRILDRTQYSLDNSVINYEITDMAIKESVITSPIEGVVTSIDQPLAGVNISPLTANFTVINPNSLFFKSEIDQETVTKIKQGQKAILKLDSFPDSEIESKVTFISFTPIVGQSSTVYQIRFELPLKNNELNYRIGMDGDATLVLNQADNVLTIPTDTVNDDNGQRFVYLKEGNKLVRRNITVGIETDTNTEIKEGITQNDQVVAIKK